MRVRVTSLLGVGVGHLKRLEGGAPGKYPLV
jgi:hypothetical protein